MTNPSELPPDADSPAARFFFPWGIVALCCCVIAIPALIWTIRYARSLDGPHPVAFLLMPVIVACYSVWGLGSLIAVVRLLAGSRDRNVSIAALVTSAAGWLLYDALINNS